jgi:hypothetical protein
MTLVVSSQKVMYTEMPSAEDKTAAIKIESDDTTLQDSTFRNSRRSELKVKWTVCCETKVNTKVPRLQKTARRRMS